MKGTKSILKKKDIIQRVQEQSGLTYEQCKSVIELFLKEIKRSLINGITVKLSGFGTFLLRHRKERVGINPKTGEKINLPEMDIPSFRAGRTLREAVIYCCTEQPDCQCRYCRAAINEE